MNRKAIIVSVALACTLVVSAGAAVLLRPHRTINVTQYVTPQPLTELKAPETHEYMEKRFPRMDGKVVRTQVTYRDGLQGERYFSERDKLAEVRVWDSYGRTFTHMFYAEDGVQPLRGFERRADGTLRRTVTVENNIIVAKLYWQDGETLFAEIRREMPVGDPLGRWWTHRNYDNTFYHRNGKIWARQVSSFISTDEVMLREELYDEQGRLMKSISRNADGAGVFQYFRADGTPSYRQVIGIYELVTKGGNEDGSDYVVKSRVLHELHLFDEAGNALRTVYWNNKGDEVRLIDNVRGDDVVGPTAFDMEDPWRVWPEVPATPMETWVKADGYNSVR
jgi:hypothetical protein